ncbi:acetyltransferase (GNAT) family protein [Pseudoduganella lurida]|uniref:Acetyltransferase (GNAT) family protein n=1 Tax=Pseudoduganella lurida TaxID=1036180 RepID=A0A562R644_9BURK|nr:GNAT family N-acetyltransferase [Pseudoduganella lurida]TWI64323.1 acetyltransferase (GNAT) family protein [Pseudoduganella lurida]
MIRPSPYDAAAFGMPAWELTEYSAPALAAADGQPGLQTIKVDPLADKALLQRHGFHYCDTLLATRATRQRLRDVPARAGLSIGRVDTQHPDAAALLAICHGAFAHGRFHRDFRLDRAGADRRYDNWLAQLLAADGVWGLYADGVPAGFIARNGASLVLHAVAPQFRGQGLARHWWHLAAAALFDAGHAEVTSSISAANVAVLNLYASLGFAFDAPQDIYHRIVT